MKRNNDIESKYETMTIIDYFIVLSKHFKILINSCLVSIIVGLICAFLVFENEYQSTSKIMSSSQSSNQSQALGIASQLGINLPSTMQSENHRWVYKAILERIPQGRWGTPKDFAGPSIFLASDASNYVNGEILTVDGGWMGR